MKRLVGSFAVLVITLAPLPLRAQEPVEQPRLILGGVELGVGGRVQTQFNTTTIDTEPDSELLIRRARLEIAVKVNDWVSGVLQPEFAGDEVQLKDAYLKLALDPALEVVAGNAYRPFGRLEQTTSKRILPIERGVRIRGLAAADEYALTSGLDYSDRDIGVQVMGAPAGAPLGLAYAAGIFRGPLHGAVGAQDSYQYAARITVAPLDRLAFGAGWSSREFAADDSETPQLERGHAFEVDVEYGAFRPGVHLIAEAALGDLDPFTGAEFTGVQGWLAYRTGALTQKLSGIEPLVRVSYGDTDAGDAPAVVPGGTLVTPGINLYFGPLNRLMVNYDIWMGADESTDAESLKVMFQLAF